MDPLDESNIVKFGVLSREEHPTLTWAQSNGLTGAGAAYLSGTCEEPPNRATQPPCYPRPQTPKQEGNCFMRHTVLEAPHAFVRSPN